MRHERNPLRVLAAVLGPGLVTDASDDDPSGIGTCAQAGAAYGCAPLQTTVVMLPMMISVLHICAKISLGILALQVFGSDRLIARVFKLLTAALLGTTISPYLLFWQANQVVDEQIQVGRSRLWQRQGASGTELRHALADTVSGMVFSEVVAYFIILASGATLFVSGQHTIGSATDAAVALRPVAGDLSAALLAVGIIGAGVLAVPVLTTSAAYGVSEAAGWAFGLGRKVSRAPQFQAVVIAATIVGMAIAAIALIVTTITGQEPVRRMSTSSTGSSAPRPSEPRT